MKRGSGKDLSFDELARNLPERSLYLFTKKSPFRKAVIRIIKSTLFDRTILFLIGLNCVFLAMSSNAPNFKTSKTGQVIELSELVFSILFTIELVLKVIGMGFFVSPGSYLRDSWNVMDFLVVVLSWLAQTGLGNYSAIRTVRVLRPLRTITGVEGMRLIVETLLSALPMLFDVLCLCCFMLFIFGIVGVQVFSGVMRNRCGVPFICNEYYNDSDICLEKRFQIDVTNTTELDLVKFEVPEDQVDDLCSGPMAKDYREYIVKGKVPPMGEGRACGVMDHDDSPVPLQMYCTRYENPNFDITSFDNILYAFLTIFQCISLEGWTDVTYQVQDAVSPYVTWYFVVMIVFGSFFAVNLALAVLYMYFVTGKEDDEDEEAEEAKSPGDMVDTDGDGVPDSPMVPPPENPFLLACYKVALAPWFEHLTMALIILNTIVMMCEYHLMPADLEKAFCYINYVLTIYFFLEMMVKILGLGIREYCRDNMNIFDGLVVISSLIEVGTDAAEGVCSGGGGGGGLSVLRSFRLLRVFKLARSWKQLNNIINTIFKSIQSITYLMLILVLFIFIFSLLGMQLFGYEFSFCSYVTGAERRCPNDEDGNQGYPYLPCGGGHYDCYIGKPYCTAATNGTFVDIPGAVHQEKALCLSYPYGKTGGDVTEYLGFVGKSEVSRHNFDTFFWATITIFQILTGENWNTVMYDGMRLNGGYAIYFVLLVVVGNYIILNLFLAILLDNFGGSSDDDDEEIAPFDEKGEREKADGEKAKGNSWDDAAGDEEAGGGGVKSKVSIVDASAAAPEGGEKSDPMGAGPPPGKMPKLNGNSLFLFSPTNPFRLKMAELVAHKYFEYFIIALICLSSINLAIDMPQFEIECIYQKEQRRCDLRDGISTTDKVFVVFFTIEMVMKVIAFGFALHEGAYIRNQWNVLDFLVVVVGYIDWSGLTENLTFLRPLRTFRALRPIRMASRNEGMKIVVNALFQSIPGIGNVMLVCVLFYVIFGILGVNLLKGTFFYCEDHDSGELIIQSNVLPTLQWCKENDWYGFGVGGPCDTSSWCDCDIRTDKSCKCENVLEITKKWCDAKEHVITWCGRYPCDWAIADTPPFHGGLPGPNTGFNYTLTHGWKNKQSNFDNIGNSILTLFEMATLEMWLDVMYDGVDARGVDIQPIRDYNMWMCIFFVLFIVVGGFFVINLFVGVTIDKFNEMKEKQEGNSMFMTEEQKTWVQIQKLISSAKPSRYPQPPADKGRASVFKFVISDGFDGGIMAAIMVNILFMSMRHVDMSETWILVLFISNCLFTGIFAAEAALKLYAFGTSEYFKDSWNLFDFIVVLFSLVGILMEVFAERGIPIVSLLRVLRVARIFRLIPKAKGLRTLFQTLVFSLPALVNITLVLGLFFFIFGIMGMNLFGKVKYGDNLSRHANFRTFESAMIVLFRMSTGESWNGIMHDCMQLRQCVAIVDQSVPNANTIFVEGQGDNDAWFSPGDPELDGLNEDQVYDGCSPHPAAAIIYFCIFVIFCAFVMLNLVIAVILDNFQNSSSDDESPVSKDRLNEFITLWAKFDPYATYYMPASKLQYLIKELEEPLGIRGMTGKGKAEIQHIIMSVDIPEHEGKIHFLETLHALAGRIAGTVLPQDEEEKIRGKIADRLPSFKASVLPKYTAAHFHAALYVQAAVRGFLARYQMREKLAELENDVPVPHEAAAPAGADADHHAAA